MCRWLAYSGAPVLLEDLLYKPKNSLVMQSLHSQLGAETTNGDGFGVGWYGRGDGPGVMRSSVLIAQAPSVTPQNVKKAKV